MNDNTNASTLLLFVNDNHAHNEKNYDNADDNDNFDNDENHSYDENDDASAFD